MPGQDTNGNWGINYSRQMMEDYLAGNLAASTEGDLGSACRTGNWLVKLDHDGIVSWQKCYEGPGIAYLSSNTDF